MVLWIDRGQSPVNPITASGRVQRQPTVTQEGAMQSPADTATQTEDIFADGALGVPAASEFTGMSRSDLYDRMGRNELPFTKIGRRRLIPRRALVELLRRNAVGV